MSQLHLILDAFEERKYQPKLYRSELRILGMMLRQVRDNVLRSRILYLISERASPRFTRTCRFLRWISRRTCSR